MHERKRSRRVIKPRIIVAAIILNIFIAAFLLIRNALVESRGYTAIGGEYLIIPLGCLLAYVVCRRLFNREKAHCIVTPAEIELELLKGGSNAKATCRSKAGA